jgi:thioredoxin 1
MAQEITDSNFEEILKSNQVVMADLWAEWCGPCRMVGPVIDELAETYHDKAFIGKVNVDLNTEIPEKFQVRSIPTILIFKNGELAEKIVGALPKATLQSKLEGVLN